MLYIEHQPSRRSVALLFFLGMAVYVLSMFVFELRGIDEGLYAAMVNDMEASGNYLKPHLFGRAIREYPLYSWLVLLCSGFESPTIVSLRVPSLLSLFGIALVSGLGARRMQSGFAGFIASSVVLFSLVSFHTGVRAQAELLQAFLTGSAWWLWYYFGFERRNWEAAWVTALLVVFLGILNVGLNAVFWFYFPMLFMPKRINSRQRMMMPAHILSALLVAVLVFVWEWVTPDQQLMPWNREPGLNVLDTSDEGYLHHLVVFPWKVLYYLTPWCLLLWAPFCEALRQFERSAAGCRFLRVIVIVMALSVWLCPRTSPLALLPLLMPVSMLIGMHFEIVLRRYQHLLSPLVHFAAWVTLCGNLLSIVLWSCVGGGAVSIEGIGAERGWLYAVLLSVLSAVLYVLILRKGSKCTFRSSFVWCICAFRLLFLTLGDTYVNWSRSDVRWRGELLMGRCSGYSLSEVTEDVETLPPCYGVWDRQSDGVKKIYYKPDKGNGYLYLGEFFHLGKPIVYVRPKMDWDKVFPENESRVYVLSHHVPAVENRHWRALGAPVDMRVSRQGRLLFQRERMPYVTLVRRPWLKSGRSPVVMQLFEGELKAQDGV